MEPAPDVPILGSRLPSEHISRVVGRLFDHRSDNAERFKILKEIEKLPGVWKDEPAIWMNHICALESALDNG